MTRPNPRPLASTQLKVPVTDDSFEGVKVENALLHRRCLFLLTADVKLRAALELATGVPWDSENLTDLSGDKLEEHVARNMSHGLQIPIEEARKRVAKNKRLANPSQIETPEASLSGDPSIRAIKREIPTINGEPAV